MTVDRSAHKRQRINAFNVFILIFVGLGSMTYGYTASIIGTTLGQPSFITYFALDTRPNGTDLIATTNGLFQAGGVIGTLLLPVVADKYGRKWGIAVSAILAIISGALLTGSTHIGVFIAFRFIAGASAFMVLAAVPIWMNEVVPVKMRAGLVDIHAVLLVLGYFIQGWVGYGFFFWTNGGENSWRPPLSLQCVWPILLLAGLYWIPESPRWLIAQDRLDEARVILDRLHSDPSDPENEYARAEFYQIQKQITLDKTLENSWVAMFRKPSYRKRAFLAIGTTFFIQCSGVLVINNYGPTLYKNLGFTPEKQLLYPAAWLTLALGTNLMSIPLVDKFPRNKWLAIGILGCMVCLIVEAALVAEFVPSNNTAALQAAVAMFFLFQLPYGVCLDGPQFAYLGELFPTHLRAKGVSLGVAMISFTNIIWLQAAPTAFQNIGWKFYLVFIIPGTIGGLVIWNFFPDTNGMPLEEIAALFGDEHEVAVYQNEINANAQLETRCCVP
ncbi:MFS transporter [Aaosphaeria arxii CBS 175.79]|uniref:MFS transporter n=1 Tax=Aaosphaeria arxii CBS 175.79 TaxID=1450172 RepID=A0A6A5XL86_9PLEO|nr:MFS transporter [Aaosphaeria arxii CBS 175.79]KAF2013703.1 MFS transporter [Aaosphaeria arxii CBS 175.79]